VAATTGPGGTSGSKSFPWAFAPSLLGLTDKTDVPLVAVFEGEAAKANKIAATTMESRTIASRRRDLSLDMKAQTLLVAMICAKLSKSFENEYCKCFSLVENVECL